MTVTPRERTRVYLLRIKSVCIILETIQATKAEESREGVFLYVPEPSSTLRMMTAVTDCRDIDGILTDIILAEINTAPIGSLVVSSSCC